MKISQISCSLLEYPLEFPLHPSWAPGRTFTTTSCSLVKVFTDEGIIGIGAGPHVGLAGIYTLSDLVAPYILGRDPFEVERISPILRNAARDGSYPWSIEMALWDIIGKSSQQPLYRLWGGFQQSLPAYASLAEIPPVEQLIERLHLLQESGFKAAKLRLRRPTLAEDIRVVEQVRKEFADDITLMVDANQAHVMPSPQPGAVWSYEQAFHAAQAMHDLNVLWLEEPLPRYNFHQLTRLAAAVEIPIAGGELNTGLHEYRQLIDQDCYDIIQADAAFSEGIFQLRKVAAYAEMHYKLFIPHTWSNGIGLGANLQLAGAIPNCPWFEFPIDPPAWSITARDFMLAEHFHINPDGNIQVPSKPGLGIDLDENAIQKYSQFSWTSEKAL